MAQRVLANTDDVGDQFAEEARKILYEEAEDRDIRGIASRAETESLTEEGIAVMPLVLPEFLKRPLQQVTMSLAIFGTAISRSSACALLPRQRLNLFWPRRIRNVSR